MNGIIETEKLGSVKKPRNDKASTYLALKELILDRKLPEGTPIPQTRLMEDYSFGRTPLREALLQLAEEGLVTREQNKRIIVEPLRAVDIDHISAMKILLDTFIVRLSVPVLDGSDFSLMHEYIDKMTYLNEEKIDEDGQRKIHYLFHCTLRKSCAGIFTKQLEKIDQMSERYRREFKEITQNYDVAAHAEILKAAEERRPELVGSLLANHYAKTSLKVISEKDPLYEPVYIRQALRQAGS